MQVTIFGHAALYVETAQHRILIDPCFSNILLGGVLTYNPTRQFSLDQMPPPTHLVITHGHFDHWHPESLELLPKNIPVLTAHEPHLVEQLQSFGFTNVTSCNPWDGFTWETTQLLTTPSDHDEPEFGLVIQDPTGTFWHMADAEVTPEISQRVLQQMGQIDLISVKYQPVVRASMGYQRNRGSAFDKAEVLAWLETACACQPKMVFPYASGLSFQGRHAWFNRYAFPLSPEEVTTLLQKRLGNSGRAIAVSPGDEISLHAHQPPQHHSQTSPFIQMAQAFSTGWEPVEIQTLAGLNRTEERQSLQQQWELLLKQSFQPWLTQQLQSVQSPWTWLRSYEVVLQWVIHLGDDRRLTYGMDCRRDDLTPTLGIHPEANFFTHFSGQGLYEVLQGDRPALLLWLAGEVRNYEKVMGVHDGKFWTLPELVPEDSFCDPLSYYLRVYSPFAENPHQTSNSAPSQDLEILTRRGENDGVINKKVLLAYLAVQEAERIGLDLSSAEIQSTAAGLSAQMGLDSPQPSEAWLQSLGLTSESYAAIVREFTAILKLEQHYHQPLQSMRERHSRIINARVSTEKIAPNPQELT